MEAAIAMVVASLVFAAYQMGRAHAWRKDAVPLLNQQADLLEKIVERQKREGGAA